jgi:ABC-type polysaccharide/polyol phosphate transport system ATPase subunit
VNRGECIGLIGANGSGKTTLLKLVNGIFMPDKGAIRKHGRVGALVEIGAGFHPLLTGRENILVYGQILGMSKQEVREKFESIVEYADIGGFLDTPVKHYSSGMYVRLGFAVAIHAEPDILLVDEVLAVGDMAFRAKCMASIREVLNRTAVIIVSHSMAQIESLCTSVLWLDKGSTVRFGESRSVVTGYLEWQEGVARKAAAKSKLEPKATDLDIAHGPASGRPVTERDDPKEAAAPIQLLSFEVSDLCGRPVESVPMGSGVVLRIRYASNTEIRRPLFNIRIEHQNTGVFEASMLIDGPGFETLPPGEGAVECAIEHLPLTPKTYDAKVFVRNENGVVDLAPMQTFSESLRVTTDTTESFGFKGPYRTFHLHHSVNLFHVDHSWRLVPAQSASLDGPTSPSSDSG